MLLINKYLEQSCEIECDRKRGRAISCCLFQIALLEVQGMLSFHLTQIYLTENCADKYEKLFPSIFVGDRMFLGMQRFNFAQI